MRPSLPIVVFVVLLIHTQMMLVHAAFCDDRASGYYCDGNSRVHCVRYYRSGKYNTYKLETFTCTQGCISTGSDSARCKSTPCQQVTDSGVCNGALGYNTPQWASNNFTGAVNDLTSSISLYQANANGFTGLTNSTACDTQMKYWACQTRFPKCVTTDDYVMSYDTCVGYCKSTYWCFNAVQNATVQSNNPVGFNPKDGSTLDGICLSLCGSSSGGSVVPSLLVTFVALLVVYLF